MEEIATSGLEGNEYVTVLSWVMNTYPGIELMNHPDLQVDLSMVEPLIKPELLKDLEDKYLKVSFFFSHSENVEFFIFFR